MPLVIVDLRTDYLPGPDFAHAEVTLARAEAGERRHTQYSITPVGAGTDFTAGARIAEFDEVDGNHPYALVVKLLDAHGRTVDFVVMRVDVRDSALAVTSLIVR
jgi:hypothetical protein